MVFKQEVIILNHTPKTETDGEVPESANIESSAPKTESLMAKLQKIQIDGPTDFATRVDENNFEGLD